MQTEPLSRFQLRGSGRDHRPLCAALATWATLQRSRASTAPPFEPPTRSDSGLPEADHRRQADPCHTPGWFAMAARTPRARWAPTPARPLWPGPRRAGRCLDERSGPDTPRRDPAARWHHRGRPASAVSGLSASPGHRGTSGESLARAALIETMVPPALTARRDTRSTNRPGAHNWTDFP